MTDPRNGEIEKKRAPGELSRWGEQLAHKYEAAKHGPDGRAFLDNHLYDILNEGVIRDREVLDIGAGAGPWTDYVQKLGASRVICLDVNPQMLDRAKQRWSEGQQPDNVKFVTANAANLPMDDASMDVQLSINVGCNLPTRGAVFENHFKEAHRVAKPGSMFVVTAPDSLTTVFTDGEGPDETTMQSEIDRLWEQSTDHSVAGAKRLLETFTHCHRATFILDGTNKPVLIKNDNANLVKSGDPILRKIPGLVVDNNYHTADEYREMAKDAGWTIVEEHSDSFADDTSRMQHNATKPEDKLGESYVGHAPFLLLKLAKLE